MPDGAGLRLTGEIGPNALLQLAPVLDARFGDGRAQALFADHGVGEIPERMIAEAPVVGVHQAVRRDHPEEARALLRAAGRGTADYILAHRIPRAAQAVLRALPARLAGPLLGKAIAKNAWTFAGSGEFQMPRLSPPVFEIWDNPLVRGEVADGPICDWHVAVFQRLFRVLVHPRVRVVETRCCAAGSSACRFVVTA